MNIPTQIKNDHQELRALAEDILNSKSGPDVGGRDNQFDLYDMQLRRHLAVMEEILTPLVDRDEHPGQETSRMRELHSKIRSELKRLDRRDKDSPGWAAEFRNLVQDAEAAMSEHERLIEHGQASHKADYQDLGNRYEQAKTRRMQSIFSWHRFPSGRQGIAAAGAAAAVAGAAFAATRYFRSGRRASGSSEDDFELRLETDENMRLISSKKVEGTKVYGRDGEKIGTIDNFMVDKYSGRVAYAVMQFGGHFGLGEQLFPLPWAVLDYEEEKDGFVLDITKDELSNAPRFKATEEPEWTPLYRRRVLVFYRPAAASFGSDWESGTDRRIGNEQRSGIVEGGRPGSGDMTSNPQTKSTERQREPSSV